MDDKKIGDAKCDVPFVQVGCAVKDKEVYPQYIDCREAARLKINNNKTCKKSCRYKKFHKTSS